MGGKRLKFPKRAKNLHYAKDNEKEYVKEEPISDKEHEARLKKLKEIGLIKDE